MIRVGQNCTIDNPSLPDYIGKPAKILSRNRRDQTAMLKFEDGRRLKVHQDFIKPIDKAEPPIAATPTEIVPDTDDPLDLLARKANAYHAGAIGALRNAVEQARCCGEALLEARARCAVGHWIKWLETNFEGSKRSAQDYMRIAENWPIVEPALHSAEPLGIKKALRLITASQEDDEPETIPLDLGLPDPVAENGPPPPSNDPDQNITDPDSGTDPESEPPPLDDSSRENSVQNGKLARVANDYYPTPPGIVKALLERVPISGRVLEPCAGHGAIAGFFEDAITNEPYPIDDYAPDWSHDATDPAFWEMIETEGGCDWVVTCPPYELELLIPIWQQSYEAAREGIALLLRLNYLEPCQNRAKWLIDHASFMSDLIIVNPRPPFRKDTNGGDNITVAWCVWRKYTSIGTRIHYVTDWRES